MTTALTHSSTAANARSDSNSHIQLYLLHPRMSRHPFMRQQEAHIDECLFAGLQDGQLLVEAMHYPTLLRWFDAYRGRPATSRLPSSAPSGTATSSSSSSGEQQVATKPGITINSSSSRQTSLLPSRDGTLTCCIAGGCCLVLALPDYVSARMLPTS